MTVRLRALPVLPGVVIRGLALFVAGFVATGLVGELRGRTLTPSLWLLDLHDLPSGVRIAFLATVSVLAATWAVRPDAGPRRRCVTVAAWVAVALLALRDVSTFVSAVAGGEVRPQIAVPLSAVIALLAAALAMAALARVRRPLARRLEAGGILLAAVAWAVVFPMAQMLFFGTTDYRRPAAFAVVFGARVYATGQPSPLLADRINTGVELYREGLVRSIVMSGGDGADGFNEAGVMRDVAVASGVDPAAVVVDPIGVSTEASVANVARLRAAGALPEGEVIAVSQAYHLPRVQLAFARVGVDVLTVPADDPQPIGEMPLLIGREVLAFWAYDLSICLG